MRNNNLLQYPNNLVFAFQKYFIHNIIQTRTYGDKFTNKIKRQNEIKITSDKTLVVKQKGECQNRGKKKANHVKYSEKWTFLTPWYAHVQGHPHAHTRTCAYQGVRNVRFSKNLECFAFLLPPFWYFLFCLIADEKEMGKRFRDVVARKYSVKKVFLKNCKMHRKNPSL